LVSLAVSSAGLLALDTTSPDPRAGRTIIAIGSASTTSWEPHDDPIVKS